MGTKLVGDHLSMGTEFDGDCLSKGINFMGIIYPGGQEVGDQKSGDQMGSGPNVLQPIIHIYFCIKSELALLTVNEKINVLGPVSIYSKYMHLKMLACFLMFPNNLGCSDTGSFQVLN